VATLYPQIMSTVLLTENATSIVLRLAIKAKIWQPRDKGKVPLIKYYYQHAV